MTQPAVAPPTVEQLIEWSAVFIRGWHKSSGGYWWLQANGRRYCKVRNWNPAAFWGQDQALDIISDMHKNHGFDEFQLTVFAGGFKGTFTGNLPCCYFDNFGEAVLRAAYAAFQEEDHAPL